MLELDFIYQERIIYSKPIPSHFALPREGEFVVLDNAWIGLHNVEYKVVKVRHYIGDHKHLTNVYLERP